MALLGGCGRKDVGLEEVNHWLSLEAMSWFLHIIPFSASCAARCEDLSPLYTAVAMVFHLGIKDQAAMGLTF